MSAPFPAPYPVPAPIAAPPPAPTAAPVSVPQPVTVNRSIDTPTVGAISLFLMTPSLSIGPVSVAVTRPWNCMRLDLSAPKLRQEVGEGIRPEYLDRFAAGCALFTT